MVDEPVGDARLVGDVGRRGRRGSPGARTRARPRRGSAGACPRPASRAPPRAPRASSRVRPPRARARASGRRRGGGWPARAGWRGSRAGARDRARRRCGLAVGRLREHHAPRVDDHRAPARVLAARGARPIWLAAITNAWFSIARARTSVSQWSRVVAQRERGRHRDDARAAHREDPVQLGEAQVVADARGRARRRRRCARARSPRPAARARTRGRRARRHRRRTCAACGRRP